MKTSMEEVDKTDRDQVDEIVCKHFKYVSRSYCGREKTVCSENTVARLRYCVFFSYSFTVSLQYLSQNFSQFGTVIAGFSRHIREVLYCCTAHNASILPKIKHLFF